MLAGIYDPPWMKTPGRVERWRIDLQELVFGWLARRQRMPIAPHLAVGEQGERAALFELRRRGVVVVAERWISAKVRGDVDLIGWDGETLCFYEVKTRTERDMNPAESMVDDVKRRMLRGLARAYIARFPEQERASIPVRFDVVSVYSPASKPEFEIFQGAFGW
jgi:putative endonuclease